jgi:FtsP/CotA-like multicopper oxidase with cupredoxin domain
MLTRRQLMKVGALGGATALLSSRTGTLPYLYADSNLPPSPPTTAFLDPLPAPPSPNEVAPFAVSRPEFQQFIDPAQIKTNFFQLVEEVRLVQLHSQLPPTSIWGYRDSTVPVWNFVPGPTFKVKITQDPLAGNIVRHVNNLPTVANHRGFGLPRSTVHLHGGHHPAVADGFPENIGVVNGTDFGNVTFESGGFLDYCYPMLAPGFSTGASDATECPSTLWYHDHLLDFTGPNVYRGLAGFYLCFDSLDSGNETDGPPALGLPSGNFDIPMVFQDKRLDANAQLVFDTFEHDGFLGDKFLVNGAIQPYLNVKRRKYRFRFLNGSNARIYQLFLTDSSGKSYPMTQVATEGGLLSKPVQRPSVMIAMAERIEVVIDFNQFPAQTTALYLENRLVQSSGRGPGGDFDNPDLTSHGTRLLKFVLQEQVPDPSRIPPVLRPFSAISAIELSKAVVKNFEFNRSDGAWTINGQLVDLDSPLVAPSKEDTGEIWRLKNGGGGWWHPIHVHSEFGRVIRRNGRTPFGGGSGDHGQSLDRDGIARKDTFLLGPDDQVDVFFRFRDYAGPFVFHCHNIEHEDMAMMARFDVAP